MPSVTKVVEVEKEKIVTVVQEKERITERIVEKSRIPTWIIGSLITLIIGILLFFIFKKKK